MGRVGRRVGHIAANGFGMRVIYNDLLDIRPAAARRSRATPVDKPTLYRESDVLSLHVTMLPGNENLVGREQLALMKRDAILINTSRGEVLDAARAGRRDRAASGSPAPRSTSSTPSRRRPTSRCWGWTTCCSRRTWRRGRTRRSRT